MIEEADEPDLAWVESADMTATRRRCDRNVCIDDARDRAFAAELFDALREATGDGVGITRESYGAGESLALDMVESEAARTAASRPNATPAPIWS